MPAPQNLVAGGNAVLIGSDLGYVKAGGTTITPTLEIFTVDTEQELTAAKAFRTKEDFDLEFTICEPTLANIRMAWDITEATAGTSPAPITLDFGNQQFVPNERVVAVTGFVPAEAGSSGRIRTVTVDKAVLKTPGPIVFTKGQETNLKFVFMCLYNYGSSNRVGRFTDISV